MQKEIDTSDWMPADPFDIDLAEIEDFLNDSKKRYVELNITPFMRRKKLC